MSLVIKLNGSAKLNELSNNSLILASKLSREIRKANGNDIKLHDQSMAIRLAEQVIEIDSPELNRLYRSFLEEAMRKNDAGFPDLKLAS